METWNDHRKKELTTRSNVCLDDVRDRWPEKLGHLSRICGLVESVCELPSSRVEIWDDIEGGCHGSYTPSSRLVRLWSDNPVIGLTLVHELGHSLMRTGLTSWDKWERDPYLSDPEELWARAFTQYVALRTGDRTLNLQLSAHREFHWLDGEFDPIMEYMIKENGE